MKRTSALGVMVLALAIVFVAASVPGAFAQDPKGGGGGGGQGASSPRGGGGGGGGGPVGGGGGGMSAAPAPTGSVGSSSPVYSGGGSAGSSPGMSAVPRGVNRGTENAGGRDRGVAAPRWNGGGAAAVAGHEGRMLEGGAYRRSPTDDQVFGRSRAGSVESSGAGSSVPWYSRSRGGNPSTGTAVARPDVPVSGGGGGGGGYYPVYPGYPGYGGGYWGGYYDCYYYPYGCGNPWGYGGFGLGYFYYNPFGWNYGDYAYWGGGSDAGGGGWGVPSGAQMGSLRLKVKPNNASVYVDGYYAGTVDDFDNAFQKLSIAIGSHRIEISAPGYKPLVFEIDIRDFDTVNYEGKLEPIR